MGSIVMTEIKVDNIVNVAGTGKPNFPVAPTHSSGSALSTINTYQYDTTTRVVTVVSDGGNKYAIDGVTTPTITLLRGVTYTFDVSDSSNSNHPLAFKNAGTSYTTGITSSGTAGTAGATVTFAVAADAPLTGLTYYCTVHGDGMGSSVTTSDPKNGAMLWDGEVKFYLDSEFKAVGTSGGSGGGGSSTNWNVSLSNVSYDSKSLSVSSQDSAPHDVATNDDGTKIYMIGNQNDTIYQYSLSTANDLSTASYDNVSLDVTSQGTPRGLVFSTDGTKMYMCEATNPDEIHQYDLSTAFDLSTASYNNVKFDIQNQIASATGIRFNNDGTRMYSCGPSNQNIYQWDLSTGFDISTASYNNGVYSGHLTQENNVMAICFSGDGTKMYIVGQQNDTIYQYGLSTAWDITTASYDNLSLSVNNQDGSPSGINFSRDGTKLFYVGYSNDQIHQYSTGVGSGGGSTPTYWGGDRAIYAGGYGGSLRRNDIAYLNMTTTNNSADFGDLTVGRNYVCAASSGTRVLIMGGMTGNTAETDANNVVDYITTATTGNATDFGNLDNYTYGGAGCGNTTRSFYVKGYQYINSGVVDTIQYFTPSTPGNATDFGDVGSGAGRYTAGCNSATRALIAGNDQSGTFPQNRIDYFAMDTAGNSTNFGNLAANVRNPSATSDETRAVWMSGYEGSSTTNRIQYVTIATTGNSTDFGDLTAAGSRYTDKGTSNNSRGLIMGAGSDGLSNEYITIQTTGNATDLSDITETNHLNGTAGSGAAS